MGAYLDGFIVNTPEKLAKALRLGVDMVESDCSMDLLAWSPRI